MRGSHLLKHYSRTQKVVTLSSAEAELGGVVHGASEGLGIQSIARDLGVETTLTLLADSSAAIGICNRSGIGRVRHLAVGQLWVQERIRSKALFLSKVPGDANPADICTKHLGADALRKRVQIAGGVFREGRSSAAPALAAEVRPFLEEVTPRSRKPAPALRSLRAPVLSAGSHRPLAGTVGGGGITERVVPYGPPTVGGGGTTDHVDLYGPPTAMGGGGTTDHVAPYGPPMAN